MSYCGRSQVIAGRHRSRLLATLICVLYQPRWIILQSDCHLFRRGERNKEEDEAGDTKEVMEEAAGEANGLQHDVRLPTQTFPKCTSQSTEAMWYLMSSPRHRPPPSPPLLTAVRHLPSDGLLTKFLSLVNLFLLQIYEIKRLLTWLW